MIHAQQASIDTLKQMLSQLLENKKKKPKTKTSSKKSKRKQKEGESLSFVHVEEEQSDSESSKSSSEEKGNPENGGTHSKRMNKLEQRLEALINRKGLQEAGVVWPYPAEWDLVPYPPKFKAPTLQAFDDKGSLNQHIYYFKSQTGIVVANDSILARLFIGTLIEELRICK